jgi:hypothetical protein
MSKATLTTLLLFVLATCAANAQLTTKDFKLLLDGKDYYKDSTISVKELLSIKQVTGNFSWLSVKQVAFYVFPGKGICTMPAITVCDGNLICDDARKLMNKADSGCVVVFEAAQVTNKSGYPLKIPDLALRIK